MSVHHVLFFSLYTLRFSFLSKFKFGLISASLLFSYQLRKLNLKATKKRARNKNEQQQHKKWSGLFI